MARCHHSESDLTTTVSSAYTTCRDGVQKDRSPREEEVERAMRISKFNPHFIPKGDEDFKRRHQLPIQNTNLVNSRFFK
ncbi:hypothetical protein TNIN_303161 [Trichonephila inaurata madagascariensis]|uniref:Uncharacterized protein n=1 Tax=Trichonephila inaurata madagascariensis TaxID=2747483 RepID=A0A8X7C2A6_9ARAC|nr:hypothetical protein TNIN_303161 [Trichonephila inaurata madagascariensis]